MRKILLGCGAALLLLMGASSSYAADRCNIAWSRYVGWEPLGYIQSSGIAAKWGKKYDVKLTFTYLDKYVESLTQYSNGAFEGVSVSNIDVLTGTAAAGTDSTVIAIGDFSNGNDGILVSGPEGVGLKNIVGREANLVVGSVSDYLLARALKLNGYQDNSVTRHQVDDDTIGSVIATAPSGSVFVTWNPMLMTGRNVPGMHLVFDSSKIPGEIIDMVVVNTKVSEPCKKAVAGAWYEALGIMSGTDTAAVDAIATMAAQSGATVQEFRAQLRTTALFPQPAAAVSFTASPQLKTTMEFVRHFVFDHDLIEGAKSVDAIGIAFPDGTVIGDSKKIKLRFTTTYEQLAADGKL